MKKNFWHHHKFPVKKKYFPPHLKLHMWDLSERKEEKNKRKHDQEWNGLPHTDFQ